MDKPSFKLVGAPCGHHGQYTFYKALRLSGERERIIAIGDFFFVKVWQDSELVSIGELQLLWTDRGSDQTLVSLRLYFLPENTPEGRSHHGEDEVLAINEKVVVRAEDLLSWVCVGAEWVWGLRAVWRGACAPPAETETSSPTAPLHHTKLDFSDVATEKDTIEIDPESPGVVVFSYPRYCRYRALLSRLEGIQSAWLRDSLVAALGGYAAPTKNTRILYCRDTFEYPDLEGHEFVCNHLAPKLKGRPRGRRRRATGKEDRSSDSDNTTNADTPRRSSLRNGTDKQSDDEELDAKKDEEETVEDKAFMQDLRKFYGENSDCLKGCESFKDLSLRSLFARVTALGGHGALCGRRAWRRVLPARPAAARDHYERYLLPYENHERKKHTTNGKLEDIATINIPDSPLREEKPEKPKIETETNDMKDIYITSKPAEELNREFLESLPKEEEKPLKITVKPVEKLIDKTSTSLFGDRDVKKLFEDNSVLVNELCVKYKVELGKVLSELGSSLSDGAKKVVEELAQKLNLSNNVSPLSALVDKFSANPETSSIPATNQQTRPPGKSSLRAVRVKPTRPSILHSTSAPSSTSRSPPVTTSITNFGINPPIVSSTNHHSDDEIVEVPYKPKTPEIIDLDEYPESPQTIKKKKLDILKERGLEVTAIPPTPWIPPPTIPPLANPLLLQQQMLTQAQIFQMYSITPAYVNGVQPPKVMQGTSIFGSSGPEKTVYGNPKDPFMPPPHVLLGTPIKPQRVVTSSTPQEILDLTCKTSSAPSQKPAVEIVRISSTPSPSKVTSSAQNLSSKNYTIVDGKAVVGSNLEITLVNPKSQTPTKNRPPQKRSSNGKFVSAKTPTPPKDYPKPYGSPSGTQKKSPIVVPNYQVNPREDASPTSSTGSATSQSSYLQHNLLQNAMKNQNNLAQIMEIQKNSVPTIPFMDPYMSALYNLASGQMDQRQIAMYNELMANQFRGYTGLMNLGAVTNTPTTKN